jgi:hypothetical protein
MFITFLLLFITFSTFSEKRYYLFRFFIAFYLFPTGIVIPIILKITYHTFSRQNHFLHESTQICHESTVGEIFRSIVTRDSRFVNGFLPKRKRTDEGAFLLVLYFIFLQLIYHPRCNSELPW